MTANRKGIYVIVVYTLLVLVYRLLLPFGDEPDFEVRTKELLDADYAFFVPYSVFDGLYSELYIDNHCVVDAAPLSISGNANPNTCLQDYEQVFLRVFLTLMVMFPILILIAVKVKSYTYNIRTQAISLSLLFPSSIYYYGLLSIEQFFLVLSLFIFLFWDKKIVFVLLLITLELFVDVGNSIVLLAFLLYYYFFKVVRENIGGSYKYVALMFVAMSFFVGSNLLLVLSQIPVLSAPAEAILHSYESHGSLNKYPVIFRPVITYMSFIFYSAENLKSIVSYVLGFFWFLYVMFIKYQRKVSCSLKSYQELREMQFVIFLAITFILSVVFILPTYANAKYFFFIFPFVINYSTLLLGFSRTFIIIMVITIISLMELMINYL